MPVKSAPVPRENVWKATCRLDARHRLLYSLGTAALVFVLLHGRVRPSTATLMAWDAFTAMVLALAWTTIVGTEPNEIRQRAQVQDLSRRLIFIFMVVAACACLFAVAFLLRTSKDDHGGHVTVHLLLCLFAVVSSWSLMHTVFALRYAHSYYGNSDDPLQQEHAGGLEFPLEKAPNYLDFAYFSFVIGMTSQVSDVAVSSQEMRQLALGHGVLSFAFNTVILALTINTASSLL